MIEYTAYAAYAFAESLSHFHERPKKLQQSFSKIYEDFFKTLKIFRNLKSSKGAIDIEGSSNQSEALHNRRNLFNE